MPISVSWRPDPLRRRSVIGLLTGLALLCGLVIGQPAPASAADTGSISGTVTAAAGGAPLSGNRVYLEFRASPSAAWTFYNAGAIYTDASGVYTVASLPAGQYRLRVGDNVELDPSYYVTYYGNVTDPAAATPVTVAAGPVGGINVARSKKPTVTGTITGSGGVYVGDATVEARRKLPGGGWGPVVYGGTNGSSTYRVYLTEPGDYALRFSADGWVSEYYSGILDDSGLTPPDVPTPPDSATTLAVGPSSSPSGINVQLKAFSTITGTVTKQSFAPTGSFGVEVLRASDRTTRVAYKFWSQNSIPNNNYSLSVPPGDYIVKFEGPNGNYAGQFYNNVGDRAAAQVVSVPLESTVSNINADLKLRGTLTGTVTGAGGAAVSGVRVYAYRDGVMVAGAPYVTTDSQGKYSIKRDAGDYVLFFSPVGAGTYAREFYNDKRTPAAATRVPLTDGVTVTADVTLEQRGSIHGVVLAPTGEPVEDARVTATSLVGDDIGDKSASTDAQGRFELDGLVDREYTLLANHDLYADTYFAGARDEADAQPVVVPAGPAVEDVTWQMAELGGISGTVVDAAGQPVAGVAVSAQSYVDDGAAQFWYSEAATTTAEDGTYTLRSKSGAATIFFQREGYLPNHYPNAPSPFLGQQVAFPGSSLVRTGFDAVLQTAAGIATITNTTAPLISGTTQAGQTLTVSTGAWTPSDVTLQYRWSTVGAFIGPVTGPSLVLTPDLVGTRVMVNVIATKPGHRAVSVASARTAIVTQSATPVIQNLTPPQVTGMAAVGEVLALEPGTWSPTPTSLDYQWYAGGVAVDGATATTYTPQLGDVGLTVSVRVTAGAAGHLSRFVQSSPTEEVGYDAAQEYVQNLTLPVISGSAAVGQTLSVSTGTWDPADVQLSYRWLRDGAQIASATTAQHVVTDADAGAALSVRVTAAKVSFVPATVTTSRTAPVPGPGPGPQPQELASAAPGITGTALVGQSLTAEPPAFATTPQLSYQWHRQGSPIVGATAKVYQLQSADAGQAVTVTVTATAPGYAAYSRSSTAVTAKHQVVLKATGKSPKKKKAALKVSLTSTTATGLSGTAIVMRGAKKVGTVTIKNGRGKLTLTKQPPGKQTYTVVFAGTFTFSAASGTVKVKIKKK